MEVLLNNRPRKVLGIFNTYGGLYKAKATAAQCRTSDLKERMKTSKYKMLKKKTENFSSSELAQLVSFKEGIRIACDMLRNDEHDDELHIYAVNFLKNLRKTYREKWSFSWKFDALLGYSYDVAWEEGDEQYNAYMSALEKAPKPTPPQLLVAIAGCYGVPNTSLTKEKAISLLKEAVSRELSERGVQLLRGLYRLQGKIKEQMYWEGILKEIEGKLAPPPGFLTLALEELEKFQEC